MASILRWSFTFVIIQSAVSSTFLETKPQVTQLTHPVELAEGPIWDPTHNTLLFVDIVGSKLYSFSYETSEINSISFDGSVTPVVLRKSNPDGFNLIVGVNASIYKVKWDYKSSDYAKEFLTKVNAGSGRLNDGKVDTKGRLFFGTMGAQYGSGFVVPNDGSLYLIKKGELEKPKVLISPVSISNGLAWNAAKNKFYYIDTPTYNVVQYDYDEKTGNIAKPKVVFNTAGVLSDSALPDGQCIDKNDNLWVALHGSGSVIQVNPKTGKLLRQIAVPAQFVTSCAWGGPNYDILFVTTARERMTIEERMSNPAAGAVFAVTNLGTSGTPSFLSEI